MLESAKVDEEMATSAGQPTANRIDEEGGKMSDAEQKEAPASSLPSWSECSLRVANSDYLAEQQSKGGYGHSDSPQATALHRFIYEYDDADPYKSAWFRHRLELLLGEIKSDLQSQLAARDAEISRAFQTLELYGVPKERARHVANGIDVLVTRMDREIDDLKRILSIRHPEIAAMQPAVEMLKQLCNCEILTQDLWDEARDVLSECESKVKK